MAGTLSLGICYCKLFRVRHPLRVPIGWFACCTRGHLCIHIHGTRAVKHTTLLFCCINVFGGIGLGAFCVAKGSNLKFSRSVLMFDKRFSQLLIHY